MTRKNAAKTGRISGFNRRSSWRKLIVASASIAALAAGAVVGHNSAAIAQAGSFLRPGDQRADTTARVETIVHDSLNPRYLLPLTAQSPTVCRRLDAEFSRLRRVAANPCTFPL